MFNIGDDVSVVPFDTPGRVVGIYLSDAEPMFKVRFYMDSEVKEEFMYAYELEKVANGPNRQD